MDEAFYICMHVFVIISEFLAMSTVYAVQSEVSQSMVRSR